MVGIYRIYNIMTGQSYIGRSKDLTASMERHFCRRSTAKMSEIDKAINYYGVSNFMFQIIEICDPDDLDWKEEYYINYFQSNIYGYNIVNAEQNNVVSNQTRKLTSYEVYNIREAYNAHMDPNFVFNTYFKGCVSYNSFIAIWKGKTWKNVHMDVYTEANKAFYKSISYLRKKEKVNFSDEEVMRFRSRYVNETAEDIYESERLTCKFNSFRAMLSGVSYKHLPVYNKKKKAWIYYN